MKVKALITALALSASTAAMAKPILQVDAATDLSIRDHRGAWRPQWTPVSQMLKAGGKKTIKVNESRDNLSALRLQTGTGATYIYSLVLQFENGKRERIEVNKWLYGREPMLTFDLPQNKGGLDRIVVQSFSWDPSTFQIMGKQMRRIVPPVRPLPPVPPPAYGLSIGTNLSFANSDGYVHLPVGSDKGRFSRIEIDSLGSATFIGHVQVTFATGAHQTISVGRALARGEKIKLDLDGTTPQAVTAVTVLAHNNVRAMSVSPLTSKFNVTLF